MSDSQQVRQFIEYHFGVLCKGCNVKIIEPEKKKNQIHHKEKCPECGYDPREEKKNKKNKKNKHKSKSDNCRAKY